MSRFAVPLAAFVLGCGVACGVAFAQPAPPVALTPDDKVAAQKQTTESAKKRQKRAECKEQAEKLLYDADKRALIKECMSK
jgi:hypothetical protein